MPECLFPECGHFPTTYGFCTKHGRAFIKAIEADWAMRGFMRGTFAAAGLWLVVAIAWRLS